MSKIDTGIEQGVQEAMKSFESFCINQIIGAWFADAPDPQALIDETLRKWERSMRTRYERASRQQAEATGIVTTGGDWLERTLQEAKVRIRSFLAKSIGEHSMAYQPKCVRPNHDCKTDASGCVLELQ